MARQDRSALYRAKAKDADEQAKKAKDPVTESMWKRIAEGYRDLAKMPGLWS